MFDKKTDDPTQLIATFRATDLVGIISFLYGLLLHSGAPTKGDDMSPPEMPSLTLTVTLMGFKMFNHLAVLSLQLMQVRNVVSESESATNVGNESESATN